MKALPVINSHAGQLVLDFLVFDIFPDRFQVHCVAYLIYRSDHTLAYRVSYDVTHKRTINLEIIDMQVFEVGKRTQSGAKIVK
jgi:hypothetical protein